MQSDGMLAGVTTKFLKDAQNLNFAVPVSAVRTFLKTTPFEERDVAEGASTKWAEQSALSDLRFALESRRFTEAETNSLVLLASAGETVSGFQSVRAAELAREPAMSLPEELKSLPDEFKYLAHYVVGQASEWAAEKAVFRANLNRKFRQGEIEESIYLASPHSGAALYHLTMATRLKPDFAPAYSMLSRYYENSGDRANALLAANALVDRIPRSAIALNIRARCYSELGQLDSAKKDLQAAIELSPNQYLYYGTLADLFVESGEYSEAIFNYETAIELAKDALHKYFKRTYYFGIGIAYYKAGNIEKARTAFNQALNKGYPEEDLCFDLGIACYEAGNFEKAITAFTQAKNMGYPVESCDLKITECKQQLR